jgi:hypothetical protein
MPGVDLCSKRLPGSLGGRLRWEPLFVADDLLLLNTTTLGIKLSPPIHPDGGASFPLLELQ